ncbi:MAG: ABC transporter permease, partial [Candidatus Poribacteria bacterium]|nr:ABC transporter permease [Candidatus Poribacteria bacterium]
MIIFHSIVQGFTALVRQKRRALLTMLGMIIGIGAVTGAVSVGEGLNLFVLRQLEQMGMGNSMIVFRPDWVQRADGQWERNTSNVWLRYEDMTAIMSEAPSVKFVLPENWWDYTIEAEGNTKQGRVIGTSQDYGEGHNWKLDRGRFLTTDDLENSLKVCVIGTNIERDLFKGVDPLGREVTVGGIRLQVVGVMATKGSNAPDFTGTNDNLLMPITTFQQRLSGNDIIGVFFVRATSTRTVTDAKLEVQAIMSRRKQLPANEFLQIFTSDEIMAAVGQISTVLTSFMVGVASITLLVGGVGIMNMMLVSVTERTSEIGLRKAVGARRSHILSQFLIEAIVLGAVGGVLGIGLGIGIGKGAAFGFETFASSFGG